MKAIQVGILGLGTVGGGTAAVLQRNAAEITRRTGKTITLHSVANLDIARAKSLVGEQVVVTDDAFSVVRNPEIDVVVELIGGTGLAKALVLEAIAHGKHVVTANKALIANHGNEILAAAQEKGVSVAFEAAVAGGIPIIKAVREGLAANKIDWIAGIINGTSNFILTEMRDKGAAFADVLAEAQRLGYAEADPTFDIEGNDAAHKLTILSALAFGVPLNYQACYLEGISQLQREDMQYAETLGYRIKLLGITRRTAHGIELRVHPTLIPAKRLIANVDGVMNAVLVHGDAVGSTLYYGAGAGAEPTASAVVADIIDIARLQGVAACHRVPMLGFQEDAIVPVRIVPIAEVRTAFYLRFIASDQAGVLAQITKTLADAGISIDGMMQKEPDEGAPAAAIAIITHIVQESLVNQAIESIAALGCVTGDIIKIRVETLN
jgi:homoserine dehydrogenase